MCSFEQPLCKLSLRVELHFESRLRKLVKTVTNKVSIILQPPNPHTQPAWW